MNELEAEGDPVPVAASKIQAAFRGHMTRQTFLAARALLGIC
jgi:hypothetical protein